MDLSFSLWPLSLTKHFTISLSCFPCDRAKISPWIQSPCSLPLHSTGGGNIWPRGWGEGEVAYWAASLVVSSRPRVQGYNPRTQETSRCLTWSQLHPRHWAEYLSFTFCIFFFGGWCGIKSFYQGPSGKGQRAGRTMKSDFFCQARISSTS